MLFHSWLRTLRTAFTRREAGRRHERTRHRPYLEMLEDRLTPNTYTVTVSNDPDPSNAALDNAGALWDALSAANTHPGADTIVLPAATYFTDIGGGGEPPGITDDLTIQGAGQGLTVIDASNSYAGIRVFEDCGRNVNIMGMTIKNSVSGHALLNDGGSVALSNCEVSGFTGGAISSAGGSLTLNNCALHDNQALGSPARSGGVDNWYYPIITSLPSSYPIPVVNAGPGQGGAIYAANCTNVTLTNCTLDNNSAVGGASSGPSTYSRYSPYGWLDERVDLTILGHAAVGQGGGIYATNSTVTLTDCQLTNDNAVGGDDLHGAGGGGNGQGGGIYLANNSTATFNKITLQNVVQNCTAVGGSGGDVGQGGGIYVVGSSVQDNDGSVSGDTAIEGAGIYAAGGMVGLHNVTLSDNTATANGGAIYTDPSVVTLTACTFRGNTAPAGADLYNLDSSVNLVNTNLNGVANNSGGTITLIGSNVTGVSGSGGTVTDPIADLIAQVGTLDLNSGQQNSLTSKLQAAQQSLARGNDTAAGNQLNAFVNQVNALVNSQRLGQLSADDLVSDVDALLNVLP
jgi:predicted outer membrane repeat protein